MRIHCSVFLPWCIVTICSLLLESLVDQSNGWNVINNTDYLSWHNNCGSPPALDEVVDLSIGEEGVHDSALPVMELIALVPIIDSTQAPAIV